MSTPEPESPGHPRPRRPASLAAFWTGFALVHGGLAIIGIVAMRAETFYDVGLYRSWLHGAMTGQGWPVLDWPWVYPAGAIVPMAIPEYFSSSEFGYLVAWAALVAILNAVAAGVVLRGRGRAGLAACWWWLAFLAVLGPVSIARIDAVTAAITLIALAVAAARPALASGIATVGAWIKVFPAAALAAFLLLVRRPARRVLAPALAVTAAVVIAVAAGGGLGRIATFLTEQTARSLQIEAVLATPDLVGRAIGGLDVSYYNADLNTFEVRGDAAASIAGVADVVLVALVILVAVLVWRRRAEGVALAPLATYAFTCAMIIGNKVGSPQYLCALAPCVVAGLALPNAIPGLASPNAIPGLASPAPGAVMWRDWRVLGALTLGIAAATQAVFPVRYWDLLAGDGATVAVLATRNALLVAAFVWCLIALARRPRVDVS